MTSISAAPLKSNCPLWFHIVVSVSALSFREISQLMPLPAPPSTGRSVAVGQLSHQGNYSSGDGGGCSSNAPSIQSVATSPRAGDALAPVTTVCWIEGWGEKELHGFNVLIAGKQTNNITAPALNPLKLIPAAVNMAWCTATDGTAGQLCRAIPGQRASDRPLATSCWCGAGVCWNSSCGSAESAVWMASRWLILIVYAGIVPSNTCFSQHKGSKNSIKLSRKKRQRIQLFFLLSFSSTWFKEFEFSSNF